MSNQVARMYAQKQLGGRKKNPVAAFEANLQNAIPGDPSGAWWARASYTLPAVNGFALEIYNKPAPLRQTPASRVTAGQLTAMGCTLMRIRTTGALTYTSSLYGPASSFAAGSVGGIPPAGTTTYAVDFLDPAQKVLGTVSFPATFVIPPPAPAGTTVAYYEMATLNLITGPVPLATAAGGVIMAFATGAPPATFGATGLLSSAALLAAGVLSFSVVMQPKNVSTYTNTPPPGRSGVASIDLPGSWFTAAGTQNVTLAMFPTVFNSGQVALVYGTTTLVVT
jgi:hypothetical protein